VKYASGEVTTVGEPYLLKRRRITDT
jgi:hypothetical protein